MVLTVENQEAELLPRMPYLLTIGRCVVTSFFVDGALDRHLGPRESFPTASRPSTPVQVRQPTPDLQVAPS